jgi:hypothetical protein
MEYGAGSDRTFAQSYNCRPNRNQSRKVHTNLLVDVCQLRPQSIPVGDLEGIPRPFEELNGGSIAFGAAPIIATFGLVFYSLGQPRFVNHEMHIFSVLELILFE